MRAHEFTVEQFQGKYPSIQTISFGEAYKGITQYNQKKQDQIHYDNAADIDAGEFDDDFGWTDPDHEWNDSNTVRNYSGDGASFINNYLHHHYRKKDLSNSGTLDWRENIAVLDRVLSSKKLPKDLTVFTVLPESPADAWELYKSDVTKPIRLHLPAYTSCTTDLEMAISIGSNRRTHAVNLSRHPPRNKKINVSLHKSTQILLIKLPKGTGAASIKHVSKYPDENEILMPRGMDIEIEPDPTLLKDDTLVWHTRITGYNPIQIAVPD
jgi:hypothetical protein